MLESDLTRAQDNDLTLTKVQISFCTPHSLQGERQRGRRWGNSTFSCLTRLLAHHSHSSSLGELVLYDWGRLELSGASYFFLSLRRDLMLGTSPAVSLLGVARELMLGRLDRLTHYSLVNTRGNM